jgi:hypothetical protein
LLAIVSVPPFLRDRFHRRKKFHSRHRKKCLPHLPRVVARQIIEIPHDLAVGRACGAGRMQRIINLNN